jgi:transcriptional regulator with XRE-family HTH domain
VQTHDRRQALADFLRQRRTRLSPDDVGLPSGGQRRTPGLRREEVAQLASIGLSWYVWLEQGRDIHPSAQVLESLVQALRLTPHERRHLFLLAGQALPPPVVPVEEVVSPALQQALDHLNPAPAYVMGLRYDYLAWNKSADALFSLSNATDRYERNLVWRLFTSPTMRQSPHWEMLARTTLAEFRAASARYPGESWFEDLIEDLKLVSPEFCQLWPHHDVRSSVEGPKVMEHPVLGRLEFEHCVLQSLTNPDLRIMIYSPKAETHAIIQRFLETTDNTQQE